MAAPLMWRQYILLIIMLLAQPVLADGQQKLQLTANFLYRFSQFTQWPPPPRPTLRFCIDNHPELQKELTRLLSDANNQVSAWDPRTPGHCDVLMLTEFSSPDPVHWRNLLQNKPVLVITDQPLLYRQTGIIRLFLTTEGFNFDVDLARAREHGLQLSAHLLKLARNVD